MVAIMIGNKANLTIKLIECCFTRLQYIYHHECVFFKRVVSSNYDFIYGASVVAIFFFGVCSAILTGNVDCMFWFFYMELFSVYLFVCISFSLCVCLPLFIRVRHSNE